MPASNSKVQRRYRVYHHEPSGDIRITENATGETRSLSRWLALTTAESLCKAAHLVADRKRMGIVPGNFGLPGDGILTASQAYMVIGGLYKLVYDLEADDCELIDGIVQPWQESGPVSLDEAAREVLQVGREGEPVAGRVYSGVLGEAQVYRIQ